MSVANRIDEATFLALAASDPEARWELWDGVPQARPAMSVEHNRAAVKLIVMLDPQLDPDRWELRSQAGYVRWSERNAFIPDLMILPRALGDAQYASGSVERYADPGPLVVEIRSPSTGEYDRGVKLAAYKARGDAEVWLLHPAAGFLQRWVRQPEGGYVESVHERGTIALAALPGVSVDLDALFAQIEPR